MSLNESPTSSCSCKVNQPSFDGVCQVAVFQFITVIPLPRSAPLDRYLGGLHVCYDVTRVCYHAIAVCANSEATRSLSSEVRTYKIRLRSTQMRNGCDFQEMMHDAFE